MFPRDRELQQKIKWVGTFLMLAGAVIVSISPTLTATPFPFVLFLLAHIIWGFYSIAILDKPLFCINVGFIPLDVYAIYLRLIN